MGILFCPSPDPVLSLSLRLHTNTCNHESFRKQSMRIEAEANHHSFGNLQDPECQAQLWVDGCWNVDQASRPCPTNSETQFRLVLRPGPSTWTSDAATVFATCRICLCNRKR